MDPFSALPETRWRNNKSLFQANDKSNQLVENSPVPGDLVTSFNSKPLLRPTFSLKAVVGIDFAITNIDFLSKKHIHVFHFLFQTTSVWSENDENINYSNNLASNFVK